MIKVFIAPRKYVQGGGVLKEIGKYVAPLGKRALVAWGPTSARPSRRRSARASPNTTSS
jgi:glycerol dehydrogenase-like iron-containing ADH family enzyme